MYPKIDPRDFESLSSFLDNQLPTTQRNRLQARLLVEPELRAALDDLRRTRSLLQRAPKLKSPRSFALTREQVESLRKPAKSGLWLRQLSIIAAVLFALVVSGDVLGRGIGMLALGGGAAPAESESATLALEEPPGEQAAGPELPSAADMASPEAASLHVTETATPEVGIAMAPPSPSEGGVGGEVDDETLKADAPMFAFVRRLPTIRWVEAGLALIALAAWVAAVWLRKRD